MFFMVKKKPIRVGFDFDGVVAYNPLRTLRLPMMIVSRLFSSNKKEKVHFPYPKSRFVRFLWEQAHKTSFFPAPGFESLKNLLAAGHIEGHIITGRYAFLNDELYDWLTRNEIANLFTTIHVNMKDEQPHIFKDRMIRALDLDYYVEDNWDIVDYLNSKKHKTEIHWIYNLIDRFTPYEHKHPYLGKFLDEITRK